MFQLQNDQNLRLGSLFISVLLNFWMYTSSIRFSKHSFDNRKQSGLRWLVYVYVWSNCLSPSAILLLHCDYGTHPGLNRMGVCWHLTSDTAPQWGVTACVPPWPNELYMMSYLKLVI